MSLHRHEWEFEKGSRDYCGGCGEQRSTRSTREDQEIIDLLRRCQPHLFAVDRTPWCWCADDNPARDPGDHDDDCKWVADVERVGALRMEIKVVTQ